MFFLLSVLDSTIPQKEKVEIISDGYKEILKFYTEQNQLFTEITKQNGSLPKEFQKLQKVINKLIEKNMKEMSKIAPLTFGRRYFRSEMQKKNRFFFCISLTYLYLCTLNQKTN